MIEFQYIYQLLLFIDLHNLFSLGWADFRYMKHLKIFQETTSESALRLLPVTRITSLESTLAFIML